MSSSGTAHANPYVRRREWRTFFDLARRGLSVSEEACATAMGFSRARLRAFLGTLNDEANEETTPALPLDALPGLLADDGELGDRGQQLYDQVLAELARIRGVAVVRLPDAGVDAPNDLAHLEELQRSTTSIVGRLLAAIADLHIDRSEAAPIRPLIRDAIACLLRWDHLLARVERDGVTGVRGLKAVR